jgi:hypothetical protein
MDGAAPESGPFPFPLPDGSSRDGTLPESGGSGPDGSESQDALASDVSVVDVGAPDTSVADVSVVDASVPDVSVQDVGAQDAPSTGTNVVVGGDFSNNGYAWHLLVGFSATMSAGGNEGCVTLHAATDAGVGDAGGIGWPVNGPTTANLVQGQKYTFSYNARTLGAYTISLQAKVGQSMSPYNPDYQIYDSVGMTLTGYSHPFTETVVGGDPSAGISFYFTGLENETVCFSNVSLVATN